MDDVNGYISSDHFLISDHVAQLLLKKNHIMSNGNRMIEICNCKLHEYTMSVSIAGLLYSS